MNKENRSGLSTQPWGTPDVQKNSSDKYDPVLTLHDRLLKYEDSQLIMPSPKPSLDNLANNKEWGKLSKAAWKSVYIASSWVPASKDLKILELKDMRLVEVDLPGINPCCLGLIAELQLWSC